MAAFYTMYLNHFVYYVLGRSRHCISATDGTDAPRELPGVGIQATDETETQSVTCPSHGRLATTDKQNLSNHLLLRPSNKLVTD